MDTAPKFAFWRSGFDGEQYFAKQYDMTVYAKTPEDLITKVKQSQFPQKCPYCPLTVPLLLDRYDVNILKCPVCGYYVHWTFFNDSYTWKEELDNGHR